MAIQFCFHSKADDDENIKTLQVCKLGSWPEMLCIMFGLISSCARRGEDSPKKKQSDGRKGNRGEESKEEGIFTYAERRWVVPSSNGSRHTGDMRVPLQWASTHQRVQTHRHKDKSAKKIRRWINFINLFSPLSPSSCSNYLNPLPVSTWLHAATKWLNPSEVTENNREAVSQE